MSKPLIDALTKGKPLATPPIWLMRQAGRYLPEYRDVRQKAGDFLSMVYDPKLASEVTLQPIRRFNMDGAVIFSDILVIPQALGQPLRFVAGEGPKLDALRTADDVKRLSLAGLRKNLEPVYEAIRQTKALLQTEKFNHTALIGFAGGPWTLACYMIEGGGDRDFINTKLWAYNNPANFADLIDLLADAIIEHLSAQVDAGAEVLQLFDSWSGILDHTMFLRWVVRPTRRIMETMRERYPHIPVIGFPRGAGRLALDYAQNTMIHAISLDQQTAPKWASSVFQNILPVQGNLDPVCLLAGGLAMQGAIEDILVHLTKGPFE